LLKFNHIGKNESEKYMHSYGAGTNILCKPRSFKYYQLIKLCL